MQYFEQWKAKKHETTGVVRVSIFSSGVFVFVKLICMFPRDRWILILFFSIFVRVSE